MDEQNQIQNPNTFSLPTGPGQPVMHKDHHWMLVGWVVFILALFFVAWGYVTQMIIEPVPQMAPLNPQAREDALLSKDIEQTELSDINDEFKAVDTSINSL